MWDYDWVKFGILYALSVQLVTKSYKLERFVNMMINHTVSLVIQKTSEQKGMDGELEEERLSERLKNTDQPISSTSIFQFNETNIETIS